MRCHLPRSGLAGLTLASLLSSQPVVAGGPELGAELVLATGYPDIAELGVGVAFEPRLSVSASAFWHQTPNNDLHGSGISLALNVIGAPWVHGRQRLLLGLSGGHTLVHVRVCDDSPLGDCSTNEAWLLRLGAGYGYAWSVVELRLLVLTDMYFWEEAAGAGLAASDGPPDTVTVDLGAALHLVLHF